VTDDGRTQKLLAALAARPEGATTPRLTEAIGEQAQPWQRAVTIVGNAMRRHERLGRAFRVGTAPGQQGARAVIWQITEDGAEWLAYRALRGVRKASSLEEAEARAHDVHVAIARMLDFYRARAHLAAPALSAGGRRTRPSARPALGVGQWTAQGLASELQMPLGTVYEWIHRGWITAEFADFWIIHADAGELERLRELRGRPPGYYARGHRAQSARPDTGEGIPQ
jgi:hypothetical protein